jgi:hypothetical protein
MKAFFARSVLTLAGLLVGLGQNSSANELGFSGLEKRLAPVEQNKETAFGVETAAFLPESQSVELQLPIELGDRVGIADGMQPRDIASCDCGAKGSDKCAGGAAGCDEGCDPPLTAVYYADVQLFFMRTHMLESAIGKLSEKYELSPRFIVGVEGPGGVGGRARYWTYGRWTPNLGGGDDIRFELNVIDLETTCRFRTTRTDLVVAGGARWANVDIVLGSGSGVENQMPGLTVAADLRTAMCRDGCQEWAAIGGIRWSILGGDWEGDAGGFIDPVRDDNVVVEELYGGFEYYRTFRDYDLFARMIFEVQNWHSDAAAQNGGADSFGFIGPGVEVGMMF